MGGFELLHRHLLPFTIFLYWKDISIAKNYINEEKLKILNHIAAVLYAGECHGPAEYVKNNPDLPAAAVANSFAAKMYDLEFIAENIQDLAGNSTRFWLLGKEKQSFDLNQTKDKVTLALTLPDNLPGALHKAISVFAWRDIDMTKIESRPLRTRLGQYFFIIDLENNATNSLKIPYALEELAGLGVNVRLLGNYSVYSLGEV